ncbi:Mini-ribonuclease 3 [compost metagenome]
MYKRGRNTNIDKVSKHIDIIEYKKATGFEALLGYKYLVSQKGRLEEIINKSIEIIESKE